MKGQTAYSCLVLILLCASLVLAMVDRGTGRREFTEDEKRDIREFVRGMIACRNISGLSLAVVDKKGTLLAEGFGDADVEKGVKVTPQTLLPIASTTKAFTSTLLAMLLSESKDRFTWDTPICEMLGEDFQLYDDTLTYQTTLTDLLCHRTGIPGHFIMLLAGFHPDMTRAKMMSSLRYHKPEFPLRTKFMYNNYMYTLAGHVAEVLEGKSWETLVRERLLRPLGMTSSGFRSDPGVGEKLAKSYTFADGQFVPVDTNLTHIADILGPSGNMVSTATDMAKWLRFHLNGGVTSSGTRLLSSAVLEETYSGQMASPDHLRRRELSRPVFPISDIYVSYNLGWITSYYRGHRRVWHSGGIITYKTQLWTYPDLGFGLYVASNGPPTGRVSWALVLILQYISDILIGETHWLNGTTGCTFPEPWIGANENDTEENTPPSDPLGKPYSDFVGKYSHVGYDDVLIDFNSTSKRLLLTMGPFLTAELHYERKEDRYRTKLTGRFWFSDDTWYIKFKHSLPGGEIDTLVYLLDAPHDKISQVEFTRGAAEPSSGATVNRNGPCTSCAGRTAYYSLLVVVLIYISLHTTSNLSVTSIL